MGEARAAISARVPDKESDVAISTIVAELQALGLLTSQDGHQVLDPRIRELASAVTQTGASLERGQALRTLAIARRDAGDIEGAVDAATKAEYVFGAVGDLAAQTRVHCTLGQLQLEQGYLTDAQRWFVRVLDATSGTDLASTLLAQTGLVEIRARRGDTADAVDTLVAATAHARSSGLTDVEAECASVLATIHGTLGKRTDAGSSYDHAAGTLQSLSGHRAVIKLHARIAEQLAVSGDVVRAEQAARASGGVVGMRRDPAMLAAVAIARGAILETKGDLEGAFACYWEAADAARLSGVPFIENKARILSAQLDPQPMRARADLRAGLVALAREHDREPFLLRPALTQWVAGIVPQLGLTGAEREMVDELLSFAAGATQRPPSVGSGLQVSVFGELEVRVGGVQVSDRAWRTSKAKELFTLLLFRRDRALRRDEIIERLWPECEPASGVSNFHFTLHALRRALASTDVPSAPTVRTEGGYQLVIPEKVAVDVDVFELLLHEAERCRRDGRPEDAARLFRAATALYRADVLTDLDTEWIAERREDVLRRYLSAVRLLAELDLDRREVAGAIASCRAYLAREPYDEHVHRILLRAYHAAGDDALVERHFHALDQLLRRELGNGPDGETTQLYQKLGGRGRAPTGALAPVRVKAR